MSVEATAAVWERTRRLVLWRDGYACSYCSVGLARPEDFYLAAPLAVVGGHCGCGDGTLDTETGCFVCVGGPCCEPFLTRPSHLPLPQVDHVIPRARGGTDDPSNLVASCGPCNAKKGAR